MKKFWASKMFWVGALTTVGGICTMIADHLAAGGALTVIGIVNIILRYVTTEGIN